MWGSIGGYIGMVLGVSIFQLPTMVCSSFSFLNNLLRKLYNKSRNLSEEIND
jgi:hypothetical protein